MEVHDGGTIDDGRSPDKFAAPNFTIALPAIMKIILSGAGSVWHQRSRREERVEKAKCYSVALRYHSTHRQHPYVHPSLLELYSGGHRGKLECTVGRAEAENRIVFSDGRRDRRIEYREGKSFDVQRR